MPELTRQQTFAVASDFLFRENRDLLKVIKGPNVPGVQANLIEAVAPERHCSVCVVELGDQRMQLPLQCNLNRVILGMK
jgi:hypothetical protein